LQAAAPAPGSTTIATPSGGSSSVALPPPPAVTTLGATAASPATVSGGAAPLTARAGNCRFGPLSALRAHTKAPYKMGFHRKTLRALNRPEAARTVHQRALRQCEDLGRGRAGGQGRRLPEQGVDVQRTRAGAENLKFTGLTQNLGQL
jgi:hypothetical protein